MLDPLSRIPGVAEVLNFGLSEYAMRIWLDPDKLANLGMTATRRRGRDQRAEPAGGHRCARAAAGAGRAGASPSSSTPWAASTRSSSSRTSSYARCPTARSCASGTSAGSSSAPTTTAGRPRTSNKPTGNLGIFQLADANGLEIAQGGRGDDGPPRAAFPRGSGMGDHLRHHDVRAGVDHARSSRPCCRPSGWCCW